ncbi:unnamed protein product [Arabidopsis halleri]
MRRFVLFLIRHLQYCFFFRYCAYYLQNYIVTYLFRTPNPKGCVNWELILRMYSPSVLTIDNI